MKLNCLIIEDDLIQRKIITRIVENHPSLNLINVFGNAIEAKKSVALNKIDLLFLDIEMPVINGFAFLDSLKDKPQVVFISSKDDYAVKAFKYNATDYIKKPVTMERFNTAVNRALRFYELRCKKAEDLENEKGDHIMIKSNFKKQKIYTSKIDWVEACGDYVKVITEKGSSIVLSTMKSFEKLLSKNKFIRIHKSYIVNVDKVKKFNSKFAEIGAAKIPISRHMKENLVKALTHD